MKYTIDFLRYAVDGRQVKKLLLLIQTVVLLMLVGCRAQLGADIERFEAERAELIGTHAAELAAAQAEAEEIKAAAEAGIYASQYLPDDIGIDPDPLARYLGCLDEKYPNLSSAAKEHACWGPICRLESPDYPDDLEWVLSQPGQFEEYDPEQPITEENYVIACNQLSRWLNGDIRPVGEGAVYMTITGNTVELRDHWDPDQAKKWAVE